ncbi:hypothetical protein [Burkholderia stagnalis]|uniref:hypothetical protein n=1 Tax=Burkholderia stagnalis TaxID=1503054 RepID=UPI000F57D3D7|nr:hypothetical protein [Burkholderia stagnalis]
MKNQGDTAAWPPTDWEKAVDAARIEVARREARALREMFDALSPIERAVAGRHIAAVRRLVEAVEAL